MFNQNDLQFRDSLIIKLAADEEIRSGGKPIDIVSHLAAQEVDHIITIGNRNVEAPLVFLEGDRHSFGTAEYYIYPPHTGNSIPLSIYFPKWAGFARLTLSGKVIQGMTQADYAFGLLQRVVDHCRRINGVTKARELVQALHDTRWSIGPKMTAFLFTLATEDQSETKSKSTFGIGQEFVENEIVELKKSLQAAKDRSKNLTEWCEVLYSINPRIWAVLSYLRDSDIPDAEKWYRYFAEVDADIAPCLIRDVFSVINAEKGESGPSWLSLFLTERECCNSRREFKQKLQYFMHARTTIPKYWYDLALNSYDMVQEHLPVELDSIDKWRVVSVDSLRASSMAWTRKRA